MKKQIHIAIADDHDIVREGLIALLQRHEIIKVIFDVSNGKELLEKLKTVKPDIILLDLDMPILSGREAFEKIKQRFPRVKIIIISATFNDQIIVDYVKKGVNSFLHKNCKLDKLIDTICSVQENEFYFDSKISKMLAKEISEPTEPQGKIVFSEIELNILEYLCQGLTSKQIGEKLFINYRTVEFHRSQMLKKINSKNVPALIIYAVKNNLLHIS
jgi:DNA-binding NarL/FixJ family response regulator